MHIIISKGDKSSSERMNCHDMLTLTVNFKLFLLCALLFFSNCNCDKIGRLFKWINDWRWIVESLKWHMNQWKWPNWPMSKWFLHMVQWHRVILIKPNFLNQNLLPKFDWIPYNLIKIQWFFRQVIYFDRIFSHFLTSQQIVFVESTKYRNEMNNIYR